MDSEHMDGGGIDEIRKPAEPKQPDDELKPRLPATPIVVKVKK